MSMSKLKPTFIIIAFVLIIINYTLFLSNHSSRLTPIIYSSDNKLILKSYYLNGFLYYKTNVTFYTSNLTDEQVSLSYYVRDTKDKDKSYNHCFKAEFYKDNNYLSENIDMTIQEVLSYDVIFIYTCSDLKDTSVSFSISASLV